MPVGKGLLTFNSRTPLPTEKFHVPGFSFVFRMRPDNTIMTIDKAFLTDSVTQWPLFHLGVSGALSIPPQSKDIDTSWIVFNKPDEPTSRHAGFLFGLGLNAHLRKIARWHLLNYLTTKHVLTSVALLLGLGVSYLGTKDPKITKLLSVHVAAMLPPGAADLKINVWIQTAGIMALGLLYYDTRHRRTSEVLLSELTVTGKTVPFSYSSSIPAELQRDESYRLACGFALGLINLGKGEELRGFDERVMIDRLCRVTEGPSVSENAEKNMNVAIPGCIVALAMMYLRTNNTSIARKLDVPQTAQLMDYVPPDVLFLRTVAKHLVMWDSIEPTQKWIAEQIPIHVKGERLPNPPDSDSLPLASIHAGVCYALGLRYAGTHNQEAKECLLGRLIRLVLFCGNRRIPRVDQTNVANGYDRTITIINLRSCQDAICLALAMVMAGSGDLGILRLLRKLHARRFDQATYGGHMAAHMAIGLLFMSGGQYTLGNSPLATAALFCATYPKFPPSPADNTFHLQALRHLWVLAAENRCLVPRAVDTYHPTLVPIRVHLKNQSSPLELTAPCLIPDIDSIRRIETATTEFQSIVLDFDARKDLLEQFKRHPMIFVSRNSISIAYKTPFEQGLARVLKPDDETPHGKSVARAVLDCIQSSYIQGLDGIEGDSQKMC
jgi:anaphase-promoting complex subunit 1